MSETPTPTPSPPPVPAPLMSAECDLVLPALVAVQAELGGTLNTSASGQSGNRTYRYLPLPDILEAAIPAAAKAGAALYFNQPGDRHVYAYLIHSSGQWVAARAAIAIDDTQSRKVQALGSAYSYGKRYAVLALLALCGDDDDDDGKATGNGSRSSGQRASGRSNGNGNGNGGARNQYDGPGCPACGSALWLDNIEPKNEPGRRYYKCKARGTCGVLIPELVDGAPNPDFGRIYEAHTGRDPFPHEHDQRPHDERGET